VATRDGESDSFAKNRSLGLWNETVGRVTRVNRTSLTLLCVREIELEVENEILTKWHHILRKGALIGVLKLDDGTVRIRRIADKSRSEDDGTDLDG
jgi:hypothetical protein